jgi:hypothetical protein
VQRRDQRRQKSPEEEHRDTMTSFTWIGLILLAGVLWISTNCLMLKTPQIVAIVVLCVLSFFYLFMVAKYHLGLAKVLETQWPKPRKYVLRKYDRKCIQEPRKQDAILFGYENDDTPVYWTTEQRSMQANLPGINGAGKTTLLLNVVEQDIRNGHPVVYFDGKGDKELVLKIWNIAFAAGRGSDVRVIDPTNPEISVKFNPFYAADGQLQQRVGTIFDSLGAANVKDEFFSEHQRAFLNAVTVILEHTGKQLTFWDVLVACQTPAIMLRLIEKLQVAVAANANLPQHKKNAFLLAVSTITGNYEDKDWLKQIRGLLNSMMPFVGDSLSLITGSCTDLVTFEEIAEKKQILIVSMNLGNDSQPIKSLGKILMRNMQYMIASRYNKYEMHQKHPFISIILDEFGLYSYQGFKEIIHTARAANAAFIFSFQSVEQLAMDVGEAFAADTASAPNSKFIMRISDEVTVQAFIKASSKVPTERISVRIEKGSALDKTPYREDGTGTRQEVADTQVQEHQVKLLPTGQVMALLPDHAMGLIVKQIHVRRHNESALSTIPEWLPVLKTPRADSVALDLQLEVKEPKSTGSTSAKRRSTNARK